jgi:voltage-gated potassium channel
MQTPLPALRPRDRRRLVARAVVRMVVTTTLLLVLYALAPVGFAAGASAVVRLVVVLVLVVAVVARQVRAIVSAAYPVLRAIEALVITIGLFLVLFALLYLGLATAAPDSFTRPLTRVSALYFTVTVLATVGFGDITAQSEAAQLLVTVQMLLGLTLLALAVRIFSAAARASAPRAGPARGAERR